MAGVVALAFVVVGARLWTLQIRDGASFRRKSLNNFVQVERLEHERGEITDRNGVVLVGNRPSVNVYVTPAFLPNARRNVGRLAAAAGRSRAEAGELSQALSKTVAESGPPILLARDLEASTVKRLRSVLDALDLTWNSVPILEQGTDRFVAYIDPDVFPSTGLVLRRLGQLLRLDEETHESLERRVRSARGLERYQDILVRRDVPPDVESPVDVEVMQGALPGVTVRQALARSYRLDQRAAHLLGYVNELSAQDLEDKRDLGYRLGDSIGRRGVEAAFEDDLRGVDGRRTIVVDSKGRAQRTSLAENLQEELGGRVAPRPGHRVVLSIDAGLQRAAEEAFDGLAGAVVLMEAQTGRLLAITSTPTFNPNRVSGTFDSSERARLRALAPRRPWRFRAVQDYFAPGSTFKVVTALAALEVGAVRPAERVVCPGSYRLGAARFRCWKDHGHGPVDLETSLMRSCDVFFYTMGSRLGLDALASYGTALGFGHKTGLMLPTESAGIMPDVEWYERNRPEGYTLGAAVNASIGQGAVSVTPIQLAVAYAAIVNGGKVMRPRVALRVESASGKVLRRLEPEVRRILSVDPDHLSRIREGLRRVLQVPGGTAYRHRLSGIEALGKTGTAQVAKLGRDRKRSREVEWKLRDHAWFAAAAPASDPEIVVVVFNEHGGGGSTVAAPIAMRVVDAWRHSRTKTASVPGPMPMLTFADSGAAERP